MITAADFLKWLQIFGITPAAGASGSIGNASSTFTISVSKGLVTSLNLIAIAIASSQITDKAAANGVASLDASALLPATQFPALTGDVTTVAGNLTTTLDQSKIFVSYVEAARGSSLDLRNTTNFPVCPTFISISFNASIYKIFAPSTGASNSAKKGKPIFIHNAGTIGQEFSVIAQDGTTPITGTISAGTWVILQLVDITTSNGTWKIKTLGSAASQDISAFLQSANNLSDLSNVSTARTNLGAGAASGLATLDSTTKLPSAQLPRKSFRTVSITTGVLTLADINNIIYCTNTGTTSITCPSDTTDPTIQPGDEFELTAASTTGTVTVIPDSGVTIQAQGTNSRSIIGPFLNLKLRKIAANTFMVVRDLSFLAGSTNGIIKWDGTRFLGSSTALIDSSDRMTNTAQPAFLAYNNTSRNNVTGDGTAYTIPYDGEVYDQNNNFSSGTFTSPLTGRYPLKTGTLLTNLTASYTGCVYQIVTSNRTYQIFAAGAGAMRDGNNNLIINGGIDADMDAGDTATITISVSGSTRTVNVAATLYDTTFSGHLAC